MSSGPCSALPEPDPLDEATALITLGYWNLARETLPPVGVISPRHRPSLPTALPAPPRTPAGKARLFDVRGRNPARHRLSAGGNRIRTIGSAPAKGSSGRCQSETAARRAEPLTGSGPRRQCLPGVAPHSLSLRGGTDGSNPVPSRAESLRT